MTVTEPIFTKLVLARRICVNNTYAEFHSNPTNDVFAHIESQADVQTDGLMDVVSTEGVIFLQV
jgi:hypothetical protein